MIGDPYQLEPTVLSEHEKDANNKAVNRFHSQMKESLMARLYKANVPCFLLTEQYRHTVGLSNFHNGFFATMANWRMRLEPSQRTARTHKRTLAFSKTDIKSPENSQKSFGVSSISVKITFVGIAYTIASERYMIRPMTARCPFLNWNSLKESR